MSTSWQNELLALAGGRVFFDEPLARRTTFRVGGPADAFWLPSSVAELKQGLALLKNRGVPLTVVGNGSNLLVKDGGVRGCVVALGAPLAKMRREEDKIIAEAGAILGAVSLYAAENSLAGLEFAVGIPGSLGGAVFMNAGAYGGEMKDVVASTTALLPSGELKTFGRDELDFSYRHSVFADNGAIVVAAEIALENGDKGKIRAAMDEIQARRRDKQPLEFPSAGSAFKRPPNNFAAALIDKTNLKGLRIGDAEVSPKHAGFIVNRGQATARDILALIAEVQRRVYEAHGVRLETEIKVIGEE